MEWIIRPVEAGDAPALAALRRMPGVFENTLGLPSGRLEQSERFLQDLDPNRHQFAAVLPDGTLVGTCGLTVNANPRLRTAPASACLSAPIGRAGAWAPPF